MKIKKILIIIGLVFIYDVVTAQTNDFRNLDWGMELSKVKSLETCRLVTELPSRVYYDCTIADIKGQIVYTFTTTDLLMRAKYFFTPEYTNINFYIKDYKLFQELLTSKYGAPAQNNVVTINKNTISENEWAPNLLTGNLRLETIWKTGRTDIFLTLSKFNDEYVVQIDYISPEMSKVDYETRKEILSKSL